MRFLYTVGFCYFSFILCTILGHFRFYLCWVQIVALCNIFLILVSLIFVTLMGNEVILDFFTHGLSYLDYELLFESGSKFKTHLGKQNILIMLEDSLVSLFRNHFVNTHRHCLLFLVNNAGGCRQNNHCHCQVGAAHDEEEHKWSVRSSISCQNSN